MKLDNQNHQYDDKQPQISNNGTTNLTTKRRSNSFRQVRTTTKPTSNVIKPIALRPNQKNTNSHTDKTSDINSTKKMNTKFKSIDSINHPVNNPTTTVTNPTSHSIQRRNTMPILNCCTTTSRTNLAYPTNHQNNQIQPRPHLNFIKMKLQQFRQLNSSDSFLHTNETGHLEKRLQTLDLNNNNNGSLNNNNFGGLNRRFIFSSNSSLFSSVSTCSIFSCRNGDLNESDLDLALIENDLNY